jgi:ABC-type transport system involved in cytochrome c biogenesis permease component
VFALIKPSLFPFALFGANRRSWWLALAAFAALSLPFGSMWADWVASVVNSRGGGILYSALEIPMLLLPLVAWLGRTDHRREPGTNVRRAPGPIADEHEEARA